MPKIDDAGVLLAESVPHTVGSGVKGLLHGANAEARDAKEHTQHPGRNDDGPERQNPCQGQPQQDHGGSEEPRSNQSPATSCCSGVKPQPRELRLPGQRRRHFDDVLGLGLHHNVAMHDAHGGREA